MSETLIILTAGIILLLLSIRSLLRLAELLSDFLKLSPLIIGMTLVAIGTSLPELSISTVASIKGDLSLAIGNIVGSNIVNVLLVFSVGILIGKLRIGSTKTPRNALILLVFTLIYTITHIYDIFPKAITGIFLISCSIIITLLEYKWATFGRNHEDVKKFKKARTIKFTLKKSTMLALSILGVIFGGFLIVNSIENLSVMTGISTGVLGLTLTAVATSLPELLTTIFSQEEHNEKMTIGNILGSNIYNLLLIGGLIDLFSTNNQSTDISWIVLNVVTFSFVVLLFAYRGKVIPKTIGVIGLLLFIGYILFETKYLY
jgi:cation:H+ antiporter